MYMLVVKYSDGNVRYEDRKILSHIASRTWKKYKSKNYYVDIGGENYTRKATKFVLTRVKYCDDNLLLTFSHSNFQSAQYYEMRPWKSNHCEW